MGRDSTIIIFNFQFPMKQQSVISNFQKNGFTMVEMLVSIGILVLVAVGIANLFFSTIKSGNKTDNLIKLRQTGSYALNVLRTKVRNADSVVCTGVNVLTVRDSSGAETVFEYDGVNDLLTMDSENLAEDVTAGAFDCGSPLPNKPAIVEVSFTIKLSTEEEQDFNDTISLRDY